MRSISKSISVYPSLYFFVVAHLFFRLQKSFRIVGDFLRNKCPLSSPSQAQSWHKGMVRTLGSLSSAHCFPPASTTYADRNYIQLWWKRGCLSRIIALFPFQMRVISSQWHMPESQILSPSIIFLAFYFSPFLSLRNKNCEADNTRSSHTLLIHFH